MKFQELGRGLSHLADSRVTSGRDARYKSISLTGGALLSRDTVSVTVNGTGAHTELHALFLPGEGQTHDHHTALDQTGTLHKQRRRAFEDLWASQTRAKLRAMAEHDMRVRSIVQKAIGL